MSPDTASEAARLLRRLLDALPTRGGHDEASRQRVLGAALGLESAAEKLSKPPSDTQTEPFV